jgi:2-phosphoglycolate phosphatase
MRPAPIALLFDLDGTLIDSAPDLAGVANEMRAVRGLEALPYGAFRPMVGSGARGMVRIALGVSAEDDGYLALRDEFLDRYATRMTQQTVVFDRVVPLLDELQQRRIRWGIVTNKAERFAQPLIRALGLDRSAATLVCGDTTPHSKPHPAPLLEAARRMDLDPASFAYVGDDHRDVVAGRAAGMGTIAAAWGYLGNGEAVGDWGADHVIHHPAELLNLL